MNNVSKLPDRRVIEEEAYDWLVRLDRDEPLSEKDLEELREWLGRGPVYRETLNSLNAFWSNNVLTELMVPLGKNDARVGVFVALNRRLQSPGAVTAAVALLMLAVALGLWFRFDALTGTNGLYLTAVGQQKSVHLADGSTIQLNTNSQVKVEYNNRYRNIRLLRGEAYFKVAKNPELPFRVYAGADRIQATGTAFIVYRDNNAMNVVVTEGRIALAELGTPRSKAGMTTQRTAESNERKPIAVDPYVHSIVHHLGVIEAAHSVTLNVTDSTSDARQELASSVKTLDAAQLARRQSWRKGVLIFAGDPLDKVVKEISRYTTVSIAIADPKIRKIQIGGRFKVGKIDEMLAALKTNLGIRIKWLNNNRVQLMAK